MSSCAHETAERPPGSTTPSSAPTSAPTSVNDTPFPSTAFTSDAPPPVSTLTTAEQRERGRFETRRIGEEPASPASRFHGAPIDLDLKSADLANVFRLIADVGHVNIVVAGEVTGTITLKLKRVPWDQALDVVARAKDLDVAREGNVILIATRKR